jgi:hypothetical protein
VLLVLLLLRRRPSLYAQPSLQSSRLRWLTPPLLLLLRLLRLRVRLPSRRAARSWRLARWRWCLWRRPLRPLLRRRPRPAPRL